MVMMLLGQVSVEDLAQGPAPHEVAVIAPPCVVGDEEGVRLVLELADAAEVPPVEGRAPAVLEDRAVETLADGVVIRRARRDPVVVDPWPRDAP